MAVVSQLGNRSAPMAPPGKVDPEFKEFWAYNAWVLVAEGRNLSSFERNRAFLNVKGQYFVDISHLTGADNDGDGRAVVAADFRNCGMVDLIVRQAGGGPLLYYQNNLPRKNYLMVSLQGRESNRQGIGARLTATINGKKIVREMYPANTFFSQAPNIIHFGLGDAEKIDSLTIQWPSGKTQELRNVQGGRHIRVDEGRTGDEAITQVAVGKKGEGE